MQSSKTSNQGRKKPNEAAVVNAEAAPSKEAKNTGRAPRTSQSKKAVEPVPAAAKSHRKAAAKTTASAQPAESVPVRANAKVQTSGGGSVALAADPVGPLTVPQGLSHEEVAKLAYSYWVQRNYEHGYAEYDWHLAVEKLTKTR